MNIVLQDAFQEDFKEHFSAIEADQPAAALRFASEVERLIVELQRYPKSGRVWRSDDPIVGDVRFRIVGGYQILMFYRTEGDTVLVLRAIHGARDDIAELLSHST